MRTRHSKLAQKLATRRNVKFPRQLSPKLAQFGGKTAQLATETQDELQFICDKKI